MLNEKWKDVKGWEESYQVSNLGRVKAKERRIAQSLLLGGQSHRTMSERLLKLCDNRKGYLYVVFSKPGKRKNCYVHRLVAEAFIGEIPDGYVVNHLDYNTYNNCVSNLEIATKKGNVCFSRDRMKHPQSEECQI